MWPRNNLQLYHRRLLRRHDPAVLCVVWVGVGMYDGLVIQIVGWVHWSRSRVDVPIRLHCDQFQYRDYNHQQYDVIVIYIYDMMRMRLDVNTWMTFIRDFTISTVICHIKTWFELWFLNIWCRMCDNECQKIKVTYPGCHSKNPGEFIRGNYFKSHWVKLEPGQNRYQTSYSVFYVFLSSFYAHPLLPDSYA